MAHISLIGLLKSTRVHTQYERWCWWWEEVSMGGNKGPDFCTGTSNLVNLPMQQWLSPAKLLN